MLTAWGLVGAGLPTALAQGAAPTGQLTPDQHAIVDKRAKPAAVPGVTLRGRADRQYWL